MQLSSNFTLNLTQSANVAKEIHKSCVHNCTTYKANELESPGCSGEYNEFVKSKLPPSRTKPAASGG